MKDKEPSTLSQTRDTPQADDDDKTDTRTRSENTANLKNNAAAETTVQPEVDPMVKAEAKIAELESKVAEYLDQLMRSQAELQNVKKRSEREIAQVRIYANEHFATELLAIKDSLEMGLQSGVKEDVKKLHEGLELTLKLLQQIFEKFGIEEINPEGEVFNPERHQAMMTQVDTTRPPNTVLKVLQKGYLMNDRLLRAAMVCVSSVPETSPTAETTHTVESASIKGEKKTENKESTGETSATEAD